MQHSSAHNRVAKRKRSEALFHIICIIPPALFVLMFTVIITHTFMTGVNALINSQATLPVDITQIKHNGYAAYKEALVKTVSSFADIDIEKATHITNNALSGNAINELRSYRNTYLMNSLLPPGSVRITVKKQALKKDASQEVRDFIDLLRSKQALSQNFNKSFFTKDDSMYPETAGILGSIMGTLLTMLVFMSISIPLGVIAGLYLGEIMHHGQLNQIITTIVINLAAVPTIIHGLLAFSIFVMRMKMAQASSLLAGITLTLIALPTIIATTVEATQMVPKNIKKAAAALGANKVQIVLHHTLPAALSQITTNIILSLARVVGETTPLAIIGMLIFAPEPSFNLTQPTTTIPIKIFLWLRNNNNQFTESASAAVLVLIFILIILNLIVRIIEKTMSNPADYLKDR